MTKFRGGNGRFVKNGGIRAKKKFLREKNAEKQNFTPKISELGEKLNANSTEINGFLTLPFSLTLSGCSGSGKSFFVRKLLMNQKEIIGSEWKKIFYISRFELKDLQRELKHLPIVFINEIIPSLDELKQKSAKNEQNLVVLDDLMSQSADSGDVKSLFSEGRHINFSVIYCTQNLFQGGRFARTIRLNTNYLVLFKQIHDRMQIERFFVSMKPKKWQFLIDCYDDATSNQFGYFLLDFRPHVSHEFLRMRASLDINTQILYVES